MAKITYQQVLDKAKSKFDKAQAAFEASQAELNAAREAHENADEANKAKTEKALLKATEKHTKNVEAFEASQAELVDIESNPEKYGEAEESDIIQSSDEKYSFHKKDAGYVHVRMSRIEKLASGASVEDPGSVRYQMFRPEVFEDQKFNKEKGLPSIWDQGETVQVVHDPAKV